MELAALPAGDSSSIPTEWDDDDDITTEADEPEFLKDPEPESLPEKKMVYPLGKEAVEYAARVWNCDFNQAMKDLQRKNLGKLIAWEDLVQIVEPSGVGSGE